MKITVKAKQAGRKHALIENREIEIGEIGETPLLKDFLKAVVRQQVEEFNSKTGEKSLLGFFEKDEIDQKAVGGKVGFGRIYNKNRVDISEAQETALLAFEDGLFSVFIGDEEIRNVDDKINLSDVKIITFIRLTFLAGSYW